MAHGIRPRRWLGLSLVILCILLTVTPLSADRWELTFNASPDHAATGGVPASRTVMGYALVLYFRGESPLWPFALGLPEPVNGRVIVDVDAYITGLPPGTYDVRIETVGHGASSRFPVLSPAGTLVIVPPLQQTIALSLPPVPQPAGAPTVIKR